MDTERHYHTSPVMRSCEFFESIFDVNGFRFEHRATLRPVTNPHFQPPRRCCVRKIFAVLLRKTTLSTLHRHLLCFCRETVSSFYFIFLVFIFLYAIHRIVFVFQFLLGSWCLPWFLSNCFFYRSPLRVSSFFSASGTVLSSSAVKIGKRLKVLYNDKGNM